MANAFLAKVDELVVRYKCTKDAQLYDEIFKLIKPKMMSYSEGVIGNREDKDDCYQELFFTAARCIDSWDPIEAAAKKMHFMWYLGRSLWCDRAAIAGNGYTGERTREAVRANFTIKDPNMTVEEMGLNGKDCLNTKVSIDGAVDTDIAFSDVLHDRRKIEYEEQKQVSGFLTAMMEMAEDGLEKQVIDLIVRKKFKIVEVAKVLMTSDGRIRNVIYKFREKMLQKYGRKEVLGILEIFSRPKIVDMRM